MSPHQSQIWFAGHWMKDLASTTSSYLTIFKGNFYAREVQRSPGTGRLPARVRTDCLLFGSQRWRPSSGCLENATHPSSSMSRLLALPLCQGSLTNLRLINGGWSKSTGNVSFHHLRSDACPSSPKEKTRAPTDNFKVHTATRMLASKSRTGSNKRVAVSEAPFHFYLATFCGSSLAGLLKVENLCIGMSDANRKHQQFIGTPKVFQKTSTKVLTAISNSSVPSKLGRGRAQYPASVECPPLFQVTINYRVRRLRMSVDDFDLNYDRSVMGNAPYDMSFHVTPCANGSCIVELNCRDYLYSL
ncbi:uncharacterized protein ATNIH1004_001995 [Aspergillus tanneri]|uniref:Uncharacterized protein n=1 Tax=Aspergillus tanneri TaxID=1220188 RepID=A0A5M9MEA1_9EURO|nr:uncharacterized protein ATNIH1004_001995 [Aspergillus tanneri]KAA8641327.1 hypothetical protein ATNIH1004_001995 [Aspergillus tanneri]